MTLKVDVHSRCPTLASWSLAARGACHLGTALNHFRMSSRSTSTKDPAGGEVVGAIHPGRARGTAGSGAGDWGVWVDGLAGVGATTVRGAIGGRDARVARLSTPSPRRVGDSGAGIVNATAWVATASAGLQKGMVGAMQKGSGHSQPTLLSCARHNGRSPRAWRGPNERLAAATCRRRVAAAAAAAMWDSRVSTWGPGAAA